MHASQLETGHTDHPLIGGFAGVSTARSDVMLPVGCIRMLRSSDISERLFLRR